MKRIVVAASAAVATAVVGAAVPLALTLSAEGTEQPPQAGVSRSERQGPPAWAEQAPGPEREAAKARWKQQRRADLEAWKAWKKDQQKVWREAESHDGPPPWAGGPWQTGPSARR